ncbi:MAG: helix-turn-helix domain-containing protein [Bacteroidota bacterium]
MKPVGEKIKQIRKSKGISQTVVADICGIKQSSYANIENGKTQTISIEVGKGIAKALGVSFVDLFEIETNDPLAEENSIKIKSMEWELETLYDVLKERKEHIELLKNRIEAYKKLLLISTDAFLQPYFVDIDSDIKSAKSDKERNKLIKRKKKLNDTINNIKKFYIDMGLLTKDEIEKFRSEGDEINVAIFKKNEFE